MQRRCREARIECVQWDSRRPHETASIVLVTPESAVTKTFSTFVNRLRSTYQLDRIVIDECHMILDSGSDFRPKLRALGAGMVQIGTRLVFLTATLPPQDEPDFFRAVQIPPKSVYMFRGPTTRQNVQYQVQEVEGEIVEGVCRLVKQKLEQYPAPSKIIIYRGIDGRNRGGIGLSNLPPQCRRPGRKSQTHKGIMDLPDIRVVIHAGQPRKLRDYAQESGQAGRDRENRRQ